MGKVRVYELAKELGMSNKELVSKLQAMEYPVKSHSSTIEEGMVGEIRKRLADGNGQGAPAAKSKRTVIRRRKKIVALAPVEEPVEAEAPAEEPVEAAAPVEAEAEAVAEAVEPASEPVVEDDQPEEEAASAEPGEAEAPAVDAEAAQPEEAPEKEEPDVKIKRIGKPKGQAAKIISRPVVVIPEPESKPKPGRKPKPKPAPETRQAQEPQIPIDIPPDPDAEPKRSKKRKSRVKVEEPTEVIPPKKKRSRRKEIIEQGDLYEDGISSGRPRPGRGRKSGRAPKAATQRTIITTPKAIKRRVKMSDAITVAELSKKMGIKAPEVIKKLIELGVMANINQAIDFETATLVATEFEFEVSKGVFDEENLFQEMQDSEKRERIARPPVVTVMGHVDHGKTSLLDAIRETNVTAGEAGGITQHIGAYHVTLKSGDYITFLDTPGHEAFTAMRARGAGITDIVILIVAADDGVMEQTREAIDHANAAEVPLIVAVNKIDKEGADPDRVKRDLSDLGLMPEEWGGDTLFANVSAKTGEGIDDLLELILLQTEISELTAPFDGNASGHVVEAHLNVGRGPVATVLIQAGTLKTGDSFVCGIYSGRIRAMLDDAGDKITAAGPSVPVLIQGISGVPSAGDEFIVLENEKTAKQVSQHRQIKQRENDMIKTSKITLENLYERIKEGNVKELNLILKADVQGSLEAVKDGINKLSTDAIKVNILRFSTGAINDNDVMLASASNASIIGFHVRPNAKTLELAEAENVEIRYYDVIYKLTEEVIEAMTGMLEPNYVEKTIGQAEVKEAFHVSKVGTVAGSAVTNGTIQRGAKVRLLRDGVVLFDGMLSSLKRFKDDAREVTSGYECGIGLENFNDIKTGDLIEAYIVEEHAATL